ncbi:MAG: S1-like domain-containing RNA-binding protein [Verrucomicrobiota bacterium]|nr:S1-like domain-containing RNA-binding protein [Verrucomicrobiota bacterium]
MPELGKYNQLPAVREAPPGLFLDGGDFGEILMPRRYMPERWAMGQIMDVFVYRDSEDRLVATTEKPLVQVGEFANLKVVSINPNMGAFLDWGLAKDLLLPIREQTFRFRVGNWVIVYVYVDERSNRIVASSRLVRHLSKEMPPYVVGAKVELLILDRSELGYNAIVNNTHRGLLYHTDIGSPLAIGSKIPGYIRAVRPDKKIDLGLDPTGYTRVAPLVDQIIEALKANHGRLPFDDQSPPEAVRKTFGTSKNAFKQALGALYRDRRIDFTSPGIRLME